MKEKSRGELMSEKATKGIQSVMLVLVSSCCCNKLPQA